MIQINLHVERGIEKHGNKWNDTVVATATDNVGEHIWARFYDYHTDGLTIMQELMEELGYEVKVTEELLVDD